MKIKNLFLLLLFIFLSLFSFVLLSKSNFDSFPVTDINQQFLYAQGDNLIQGVSNQFACHGYANIFGIRTTLYKDCTAYITSFIGVSLVRRILFSLNLGSIIFMINSLFLLLAIYFSKKLYIMLFGTRGFSLGFLLIFPSLIWYSIIPYNNMASVALFIIIFYYLLKYYIYDKSHVYLFVTLPFIVLTFALRSIDIVPILFIFLILFLGKYNRKKIIFSFLLGTGIFVFTMPIFFFNYKIYGSVLGPRNLQGKSILNHYQRYQPTGNDDNTKKISKYSLSNLSSLKTKLWDINPLLVLFFFLGFTIAYLNANNRSRKVYLLLLSISAVQIIFYGIQQWSGIGLEGTIGDPFSRYILSSVLVMLLFASIYFNLIKSVFVRILTISSLFILSFTVFFNGKISFFDFYNQIIEANYYKSILGSGDVVFTALRDKFLFPTTNFAIYTALAPEDRVNITISEMKKLLNVGYGVYFSKDSPVDLDYSLNIYLEAMNSTGLEYIPITGNRMNFYKIRYTTDE